VYDVKEGWEPLCEFLGVEVPEGKPFPHLNDTEAFRAMVRQRERMGMALTFAVLIGGASLAALALLYLFSATSRRTSARA
jgi:hypothetical protein